jgi:hypothetical protein
MLTFCDEIETDVLQKMLQAMATDLSAQFEIMVNTGSACLKVNSQCSYKILLLVLHNNCSCDELQAVLIQQ